MNRKMKDEPEKIKIQLHNNLFNIIVNFGLTTIFSCAALIYPYYAAAQNMIQIDTETGLTIFTNKGKIFIAIVALIYISIIVVFNYHHEKNTTIMEKRDYDKILSDLEKYSDGYDCKCAEVELYKEMQFFDTNISEHKHANLQNVLNHIVKQNQNPYYKKIISIPEDQIKHILQEMVHVFSKICEIDKSLVNITACYKFDEWKWVTGCEPHGSVGFKELRENPSMFKTLETGNDNYLFYNNKKKAHDDRLYVYDGEEDDGSIIGRKVIVKDKNNTICITLMYFLSTYDGHQITESEGDVKQVKKCCQKNFSAKLIQD